MEFFTPTRSSAEFFLNFEKKFRKAPIEEQKELIRKVVLGIRISPKERLGGSTYQKSRW
jgi:hypothetical protein